MKQAQTGSQADNANKANKAAAALLAATTCCAAAVVAVFAGAAALAAGTGRAAPPVRHHARRTAGSGAGRHSVAAASSSRSSSGAAAVPAAAKNWRKFHFLASAKMSKTPVTVVYRVRGPHAGGGGGNQSRLDFFVGDLDYGTSDAFARLAEHIQSAAPVMTALPDAPVHVKAGQLFQYTITQTDTDTALVQSAASGTGGYQSIPDVTCRIGTDSAPSMSQCIFTPRGIGADGTIKWDVIGQATTAPGIYRDHWVAYNKRTDVDRGCDAYVEVYQTVIVDPAPSPAAPPPPSPAPSP